MIEKMKFLSITGPKADIDRVVDQYLSKYEIHLENALASLQSVQSLTPYIQVNPYRMPPEQGGGTGKSSAGYRNGARVRLLKGSGGAGGGAGSEACPVQ